MKAHMLRARSRSSLAVKPAQSAKSPQWRLLADRCGQAASRHNRPDVSRAREETRRPDKRRAQLSQGKKAAAREPFHASADRKQSLLAPGKVTRM
eukprot:2191105-Pleurochrysis_carterae.AAC.2